MENLKQVPSVELELLDELENEVQRKPDYLPVRSLEALREEEEAKALTAAVQQRQSIKARRRRSSSVSPAESLKSALIDSRVAPFVATVPRNVPPALGRALCRDFRPHRYAPRRGCRVVAWNVERGYQLALVIASLRREAADVILLSEVDCGCRRSQMLDVGAEIASALGLVIVFATEKIRVNDDDVDELKDEDAYDGVEGLAILSKFDVVAFDVLKLPDASGKNLASKQRLALRATCAVPSLVDFVAVHLDAFAGRSSRVEQFAPVLETYRSRKHNDRVPTVVGGDFNTHNHGVATLHPGLTGDDYWFYRLWRGRSSTSETTSFAWNQTEAEWWQAHVFNNTSLLDPFDKHADSNHHPSVTLAGLKLWGGKLDWLLFDSDFFVCDDKLVSTPNVASDHPYLRIDLRLKR